MAEPTLRSSTFRFLDCDVDATKTEATRKQIEATEHEFVESAATAQLCNLLVSTVAFAKRGVISREQWSKFAKQIEEDASFLQPPNEKRVANTIASLKKQLGIVPSPASTQTVSNAAATATDTLCHNTAVVLAPEGAVADAIQAVRSIHDVKHVDIWPAHMTLFYPFVHPSQWHDAAKLLAEAAATQTPFSIGLNSFGSFNQKRRGFVTWLDPQPTPKDAIANLHRACREKLKTSDQVSVGGSFPALKKAHMTVGRGQKKPLCEELLAAWAPAQFQAQKLVLLQRTDNKSPMQVVGEVFLGVPDGAEQFTLNDELISMLSAEAQSKPEAPVMEGTALNVLDAKVVPLTDKEMEHGQRELFSLLNNAMRRGALNAIRVIELKRVLLGDALLCAIAEPSLSASVNADASANDGEELEILFPSVADELRIGNRLFGPEVFAVIDSMQQSARDESEEPASQDDAGVTISLTFTWPGQSFTVKGEDLMIEVFAKLLDMHPRQTPDAWLGTTRGLTMSQSTQMSRTFVAVTETWETDTSTSLGDKQSTYLEALYKGILALLNAEHKRTVRLRKMRAATANSMTFPMPTTYGSWPQWRSLLTATEKQSPELTMKELDKGMVTTVLKQLEKATLCETARATHIENVVNPELLEMVRNQLQDHLHREDLHLEPEYPDDVDEISMYAPRVCFHGAQNAQVTNSILQEGLVAAGDFTSAGELLQQQHGNLYGPGIYVSPNISKAMQYTQARSDEIQIIAGLALPGLCRHVSNRTIAEFNRWRTKLGNFHNRLRKRSLHFLGCDSHISPCGQELVLYNTSQFLPVLLITVSFREQPAQTVPDLAGVVSLDLAPKPKIKKKAVGDASPSDSSIDPLSTVVCHLLKPSTASRDKQPQTGNDTDFDQGLEQGKGKERAKKQPQIPVDSKLAKSVGPRKFVTAEDQLDDELWLVTIPSSLLHYDMWQSTQQRRHLVLAISTCQPKITAAYQEALAFAAENFTRQLCPETTSILVFDGTSLVSKLQHKRIGHLGPTVYRTSMFQQLDLSMGAAPRDTSSQSQSIVAEVVDEMLEIDDTITGKIQEAAFSLGLEWLLFDLLSTAQAMKIKINGAIPDEHTIQQHANVIKGLAVQTTFRHKLEGMIIKHLCEADGQSGPSRHPSQLEVKTAENLLAPDVYQSQLNKRVRIVLDRNTAVQHVYNVVWVVPDRPQPEHLCSQVELQVMSRQLANLMVQSHVVAVGKSVSSLPFLEAKLALQTEAVYEPEAVFSAARPALLATAFSQLARHLRYRCSGTTVRLSAMDTPHASGFVMDGLQPPSDSCHISFNEHDLAHGGTVRHRRDICGVLWRGRPTRQMYVNGMFSNVVLRSAEDILPTSALRRHLKAMDVSLAEGGIVESDGRGSASPAVNTQGDVDGAPSPPDMEMHADSTVPSSVRDEEPLSCDIKKQEEKARQDKRLRDAVLELVDVDVAALKTVTALVSQLKVAVGAHATGLKRAASFAKTLLEQLSQRRIPVKGLQMLEFEERTEIIRTRKKNFTAAQMLLNEVRDMANVALETTSLDALSKWVVKASAQKYGVVAMRRVATNVLSVRDVFIDLQKRLSRLDKSGCAQISDESAAFVQQMKDFVTQYSTDNPALHLPFTITDMLYCIGLPGIMLNVERSAASAVDPWQIKVLYVSRTSSSTVECMTALDTRVSMEDEQGYKCNAVLPLTGQRDHQLGSLMSSYLMRAYTSVLVTRNPAMALSAQRLALLSVSLVRAVEQLMDPSRRTVELVRVIGTLALDIRRIVSSNGTKDEWIAMLTKLLEPMPGRFLTEAPEDNVSSIASVLVAVVALYDSALDVGVVTHQPSTTAQQDTAALAVLAESVSRGVRIFIKQKMLKRKKSESDVEQKLLCDALGVSKLDFVSVLPDEEPEPIHVEQKTTYDEASAKRHSSHFFAAPERTNCSPRAVVACFGLANILAALTERSSLEPQQDGTVGTAIFALLCSNNESGQEAASFVLEQFQRVSMRSFAAKYTTDGCDHWDLQMALYVQALMFHNSKARRKGLTSLRSPRQVLADGAKHAREGLYNSELNLKLTRQRQKRLAGEAKVRLIWQTQTQLAFLATHGGLPKSFTQQEVAILNESRAPHDQIELGGSGLPLHHCSFPDCEQYLVDLSTAQDRALHRRHGLYKHLSMLAYPVNTYIPRFHLACQDAARTCKEKQPKFVEKVLRHIHVRDALAKNKQYMKCCVDSATLFFSQLHDGQESASN
eukprot:m.82053 g.82053  ORF g.82053 m.82053 type:complete len:2231 (+) comp12667_c0_seq2:195-6887(+)